MSFTTYRYVTPDGSSASTDPTPDSFEMEEDECYRLYRLCPCENCAGTGKVGGTVYVSGGVSATKPARCKDCRGEGRTLDLVATATNTEAVGVALVTLASEGEWDECPFGLMHRPEGETGKWLLKPWGPSARNISDAGRTLAKARHTP